jgi:hypothetical protein
MPGRPHRAARSTRSHPISPQRDRHVAWVYVAIAYMLGTAIFFAGTQMIGSGIQTEEALSLVSTGLSILAVFLGVPALMLLWKAVTRSGRAARAQGTSAQHRLLIVATAAFIAFALVGAFVAQSHLQTGKSQIRDQATTSMFDRSGLVVIYRGAQQYRNMNDRCSGDGTGPPDIQPCGPQNQPPCVTQQWLVAHDAWPLLQIGRLSAPAIGPHGMPSLGASGPPTTLVVFRPKRDYMPAFLLVPHNACYLQYRRVT